MDELPIPNRKLIEFNPGLAGKSTSILSSRGCPFQCRFCTFSIVMGRKWRPRSVKNVVEEIELLKDQKYKDIAFIDDNFTLNKKRTFRLCAEIKRNQLDNLRYVGDCRVENATFDMLRALVTAHFIQMVFGIESGTQRILDYYNKGITLAQIKQAVKNANKTRLEIIYGSFVLGAPSETLSEVRDTIKFANKLSITIPIFQILYANPISPIYRELVEKGQYIPQKDDWKKVFKIPDISPTSIPTKVLMRLLEEGVNQIVSKRRVIHHLFKALKYKYYVDTIVASIIKRKLKRVESIGQHQFP
ncbi:MAG: radical SAM protein [Candidatus Helarchaeota archaeon]|nr:radical SAM protein [Candidatus Helarchaeota archaeon]